MIADTEQIWRRDFLKTAARDRFLADVFPERKGTSVPGVYRVTGGSVRVFCGLISVTGSSAIARAKEGCRAKKD